MPPNTPRTQGGAGPLGSLLSPPPSDHGTPTSVAFTSTEPAHIVASFRSGDTVLYDLEAGSALLTLDSRGNSGKEGPQECLQGPSFSCGFGDLLPSQRKDRKSVV